MSPFCSVQIRNSGPNNENSFAGEEDRMSSVGSNFLCGTAYLWFFSSFLEPTQTFPLQLKFVLFFFLLRGAIYIFARNECMNPYM